MTAWSQWRGIHSVISDREQAQGANRDAYDKAVDLATKYLSYKPRTRRELEEHLKKKGCSADVISSCCNMMEEYHLLDDLQYCRMYIESRLESGKGMARIRQELLSKGIDRYTIEDALPLLEDLPDERDMALQMAKDAAADLDLLSMDYNEKQKARARIARRLAGRGFQTDAVFTAVRKAFDEREQAQREEL